MALNSASVPRLLIRCVSIACAASLVLLWTTAAQSQVNTDPLRPGAAREGFSAGLDGNITQLGGNVGLLDVGLGARMQMLRLSPAIPGADNSQRRMKQTVYMMANFRYTARDTPKGNIPIMNQALFHARFVHLWHPRIGSTLFVQHQFNEFQRMRVRSIWGTSVTLPLLQHPKFQALFGTGYMFEYNRISVLPGASDPDETYEHRSSNFLGVKASFFDGRLLAQNTLYVQPRWDKFSDFRFLEEIEFLIKIGEIVGFGATLSFLYDSAPPTGVKNTDTRISSNIRLSF